MVVIRQSENGMGGWVLSNQESTPRPLESVALPENPVCVRHASRSRSRQIARE